MARVADLRIYPVKSLSGNRVDSCRPLPSGALSLDRRWAFVDDAGGFWNSKRTARLHDFTCKVVDGGTALQFDHRDRSGIRWTIGSDARPLEHWFSERVSGQARLIENTDVGFPDDLDSPGPTIISTASVEQIANWFPGLTPENVRQRLRANIEIDGVPAFWEDQLVRADGAPQPFRIGTVVFLGINPCQRCVVPSRDPATGEVIPSFQKTFSSLRQQTLPAWAPVERFNHFYRATVNTRLQSGAGDCVKLGDDVEIL